MSDYLGPRECKICGKTYVPRRRDQSTCGDPDCVRQWKNRNNNEYRRMMRQRGGYRQKKKEEARVPKPDTIVAIGYAERQMAKSLEMAGKVKVEL